MTEEINLNENSSSSTEYIPEMIPPEQTYKIFFRKIFFLILIIFQLDCIKHFKYEDEYYKNFLKEKDLMELKVFINKYETNRRPKSTNRGGETKV